MFVQYANVKSGFGMISKEQGEVGPLFCTAAPAWTSGSVVTSFSRDSWLQRANLKTARAWRLKMALREVFAKARGHNDQTLASADLKGWISWARRSRLEPFKRLGATLRSHFDAVVRGMLDHRSNAFVEAMNGLMQQAKRAARGFRTAANFIAIAYLRLGKLTHLPVSPFAPALPQSAGLTMHRA